MNKSDAKVLLAQMKALQKHVMLLSRLLDQTVCPVCKGSGTLLVSSNPCPMCPVRDDALRDYRELYDKEGNPRKHRWLEPQKEK